MNKDKRLRLAIVCGPVHPSLGGPASVVSKHFYALSRMMDVTVFGVAEKDQISRLKETLPGSQISPAVWPHRWHRGAGFTETLCSELRNFDVVHAHMLWDHPVRTAWLGAKRAGIPLIITPHGSLMEPWRYQAWHKRLYRWWAANAMLSDAAFLHVLSRHEERACRRAHVNTPIRIIPNGLESVAFKRRGEAGRARQHWPALGEKQILFYLGRLWEGKGLGDLVQAWANLSPKTTAQWILVLAGPDYRKYQNKLTTKIRKLQIAKSVFMPGPVSNMLKADLFALASGFVLPSHSEGSSVALLEAMAAGVPALYSQGCNFPELAKDGGGIEVANGPVGLGDGLVRFLAMDVATRKRMGETARTMAQSSFTMDRVADELGQMYSDAIKSSLPE